jgi:hypothetical protein
MPVIECFWKRVGQGIPKQGSGMTFHQSNDRLHFTIVSKERLQVILSEHRHLLHAGDARCNYI